MDETLTQTSRWPQKLSLGPVEQLNLVVCMCYLDIMYLCLLLFDVPNVGQMLRGRKAKNSQKRFATYVQYCRTRFVFFEVLQRRCRSCRFLIRIFRVEVCLSVHLIRCTAAPCSILGQTMLAFHQLVFDV